MKRSSRLSDFSSLLLRWNRTVNLISPGDEPLLWERHIADSLQLVPLIDPLPDRAIDLGSGAGFPGLVLALATGVPFDLIEADQRKAAFLREATRITGAPARVHAVRIESRQLPAGPADHGPRSGAAAETPGPRGAAPRPRTVTVCFSRAQTSRRN